MQCVDLGGRRIIKKETRVGPTVMVFFQAEDGIRDVERSRGLGDVYKRQVHHHYSYHSSGYTPNRMHDHHTL